MTVKTRRSARGSSKVSYRDDTSSESEGEQASDYEEVTPQNKKRARKGGKPGKGSKKKRVEEQEEELPENYVLQSLSQPDIDVSEVALEWIESFESDLQEESNESITLLMNFILQSCGSLQVFEKHDLTNLESASDTIGELAIAFGDQKSHKYPFKTILPFRNNVLTFFEKLINISHEKGLLYNYGDDDDSESFSSPLMLQLITWIGSLSSCSIRPLRFVGTLILLTILVKLANIMKITTISVQKAEKQLKNTPPNSKLRLENLTTTIKGYQNQKSTIQEYFDEITNIVVGHRYRDVDPTIRQDCIKYLSQSMIIYPEYFLDAKFLRYFGWLLSDPINHVRIEVSKQLLRLYKSITVDSITTGLKQFTERYKPQMIKMTKVDLDNNVKINLSNICCELLIIGFLDEQDNHEILNNFYLLINEKDDSKSNNSKLKSELAKFLNILNINEAKIQQEKYSIFLESYRSDQVSNDDDDGTKLNINNCFKYKSLVKILKESDDEYKKNNIEQDENNNITSIIFQNLYPLPSYENDWEFLIRYLLFDPSSIRFISVDSSSSDDNIEIDEIKQELELNQFDKLYLLNFIYGSFLSMYMNPTSKLKDTISTAILTKLVNYLPEILSISMKANNLLNSFIQFWHLLLTPTEPQLNIYNSFDNLNQIIDYNQINNQLLKYFLIDQQLTGNDQLINNYEKYLNLLLNSYNVNINNPINLITSDIRMEIQNLTQSLSNGFINKLNLQQDDLGEDLNNQKAIVHKLNSIGESSIKLAILGEQIDINEYMKDSNSNTTIIELIIHKILNPLNFDVIIRNWCGNFLSNIGKFNISLSQVLNLILISTSWKLEKLIAIDESNQDLYDVESILDDDKQVVLQLIQLLSSLNTISEQIDSTQGSSTAIVPSNINPNMLIAKLNDCKTLLVAKVIDIITSIKIFYIKYNKSNNFQNFNQFFDLNDDFGKIICEKLSLELQIQLLDIYLVKESKLGKSLKIELDRLDNENVNYQDADEDENNTGADEPRSDFVEGSTKATSEDHNNHWLLEKSLCVYTLKLFSLIKTSMIDKFIYHRIQLNAGKIGGIYQSLVNEQIKSIDELNINENESTTTSSAC